MGFAESQSKGKRYSDYMSTLIRVGGEACSEEAALLATVITIYYICQFPKAAPSSASSEEPTSNSFQTWDPPLQRPDPTPRGLLWILTLP